MSQYQWRKGSPWGGLDADKAVAEFERVRKKYGALSAQNVVEYAKSNKRSELHKAFNWDKDEAAQRWWIHQARDLISAVREVRIEGGEVAIIPSIYSAGGGTFVTRQEVQRNEDYQSVIVRRALSSLEGWRERYSEIVHLCGAGDPIDEALGMLRKPLANRDAAE